MTRRSRSTCTIASVLASLPEKETTHRALDDIRESISELVHYRTTLFQPMNEAK